MSSVRLIENEWQFINELIYKIYSISDLREMRLTFLQLLRALIPCDSLTFYLADPEAFMKDPVQVGLGDELANSWLSKKLYEQDYMRWVYLSGQTRVFRQSDFMPEKERRASEYYKNAYIPIGIEYQLGLSLSYENAFLGVVSLYRNTGSPDFSAKDIYILDAFKKHLAFRLKQESSSATPAKGIESYFFPGSKQQKMYHLTNREVEVLCDFASGISVEDACSKLCITRSTLHKHVLNIYRKFNVSSRYELMSIINKFEGL